MSDVVPPEIITDILRRLPVKPLLRFRSVSKPWCALIDSPNFVKSHLNHSIENKTNTKIILRDCYLYSVDFDSLNTAVKLDHPVSSKFSGTEILGSCNGLLCLYDLEDDIVLWNPSTRKHLKLPATNIEFPDTFFPSCQYIVYGFGYDRVNDDYKVVRLIQFNGDRGHLFFSEVKVYSMKSNSWRRIQDFPYYIRCKRDYGTLANGALHWVVVSETEFTSDSEAEYESQPDNTNLIAAFDLVSEEYRLLPQPDFIDKKFHLTVGVLGDCLTLICNYFPQYVDVWVMKEYGVKESWTKLLTIAQPHDIRSFEFLIPIAYSKSGTKVLLEMAERPPTRSDTTSFFWYDLENRSVNTVRIHGVPNYFEQSVCVESLVQLNGGVSDVGKGKQPAQERKNKKRNKTKKRDDFLSVGFNLAL